MAVVWMVFLVYPIIALVASDAAIGWRVLGWVAIAGFAALYVAGFVIGMRSGWWRRPTKTVTVIFGLLILCGIAASPAIGLNAFGLLPFLVSYASYGMGRWWHWATSSIGIALIVTSIAVTRMWSELTPLLIIVVLIAVVNTINIWLIDRSVAADELRVELATSEERESVARDVHDLLGHSLTVVKLKAELAARLVDRDPDRARAELAEIVRLTGEAISGVRGTVTGLRADGLAAQVQASRAALDSAGISAEVAGDAGAISPAQSLPASWILREATTNILRHAHAKHVRIGIEPGTVIVEDDGVGIRAKAGNGLRGMAERAAAADAVLRVERSSAGGTRVSVTW
jgi:two-component system sensor histidine kinase DesK